MTHLTSLSPLQHPAYASVDGAIVPYPDVRIHVSAEALTGALSVFEGVKGYWDATGTRFSVRTPRAHYERLVRSARLLAMTVDVDYPEFLGRLGDLAEELVEPGRDLWFRATLYGLEDHDGEDTRASLVVTAYPQPVEVPAPLALTVSSWCRGTDADLSARIKTGANLVTGRMARVEARRRGADEAFLLNRAGRIAGATSACVVMATDDGLVSPPPEEGALDSLTVRALGEICARDGIPYVSRPVERTELLSAREVALAGTATELVPVADVDGTPFPTDGLLATLGDIYRGIMRGDDEVEGIEMVPLVSRPAPVVELHARDLHAGGIHAAPPSPYFDVDHGHDTGALPRLDDDAFAALDADGPGVPTGAIPRQPQLHILTQRS